MRFGLGLTAALAGFVSALAAGPAAAQEHPSGNRIALMGSIPIYWGEAADMGELLTGDVEPHWARAVIEEVGEPAPLDFLGQGALADFDRLLMAQPRALSAEENVALDAWVRGGGRLLLFADPLMTGESRFGLGDRRRPQDVVLLSPILAHWGLELQFDPAQAPGLVTREIAGGALPVAMAGAFVALDTAPHEERCTIEAKGLIARCALGDGAETIVADAALLDLAGPYEGAKAALRAVLAESFGEIAGAPDSLAEGALYESPAALKNGLAEEALGDDAGEEKTQ